MRPTDRQLDWIQAEYLARTARPRSGVNVPPPAREIADDYRRRFRTRVSGQWIAAVVRMHFRGWLSERNRPLLTWAQVRFVRETVVDQSVSATTRALNRAFGTEFSTTQIRNFMSDNNRRGDRPPIHAGDDGRFEKRHKRCVLPVGTETLVNDNRRVLIPHVKVDEIHPWSGRRGRMKAKRLVVWERTNGPVPAGFCVVHLDGDVMNCELDNLVLVSRGELARLNQMGWTSLPADRGTRLAAVATARLKQAAFDLEPSHTTLWKRRKEEARTREAAR